MAKTIKDYEKEIKGIPFELRTLRLQKVDLGNEINQVFNSKIALIKEIGKLKRNIEVEEKGYQELLDKNRKVKKSVQEEEGKLDERKRVIRKDLANVEDMRSEVLEAEKANGNTAEGLKKRENKLRENISDFSKEKSVFAETEKQFKQEKIDFEKEKKATLFESSNLNARKKIITKNEDNAIVNLDEAKRLKGFVEEKIKELEKDKIGQSQKEKKVEAEKKQLEKNKEDFEADKEELKKKEEKLDARKQSLNRAYDDLKVKEDEVEVTKLRVNKIVRDKNIGEELKKLQKELG